jgi:hypothetical protein
MDFSKVSFPLRVYRVYYRPTDLLPLPLLISAVIPVDKQNNIQVNVGPLAPQFAPPPFLGLYFQLILCPNLVNQSIYSIYRTKFILVTSVNSTRKAALGVS